MTRYSGRPSSRPKLTDLVLEEHPQGLDDLLEVHIVGQAAHVVVALDDGGVAGAGLDHVGIDGALDQVSPPAPIFLASASKTRMNSSPMIFRLRSGSSDAGQFEEEAAPPRWPGRS